MKEVKICKQEGVTVILPGMNVKVITRPLDQRLIDKIIIVLERRTAGHA